MECPVWSADTRWWLLCHCTLTVYRQHPQGGHRSGTKEPCIPHSPLPWETFSSWQLDAEERTRATPRPAAWRTGANLLCRIPQVIVQISVSPGTLSTENLRSVSSPSVQEQVSWPLSHLPSLALDNSILSRQNKMSRYSRRASICICIDEWSWFQIFSKPDLNQFLLKESP